MPLPLFNAGISLRSTGLNTSDNLTWDIQFSIQDGDNVYVGTDVVVGNFVIIDTSPYLPGTLGKYRITSITSKTSIRVICTVVLDDPTMEANPPDLNYCTVQEEYYERNGFICEATAIRKFLITPAPSFQGVADKFGIYIRNTEYKEILDTLSGGGSAPWVIKTVANTNDVLAAGAVIGVNSTGGVFTLYFPSSPTPTAGDTIRVADVGGACFANNVTMNGNGHNIAGVAENFLIDVNYIDITFIYTAAFGWSPVQ